ncbi:MAG: FliH/SctL family protein [Pseudomonadota bacterium]
MSSIIPKEDAQAARRWQPQSVDTPGSAQARAPDPTFQTPPTAQQFEAVYAQAEAQGREEGRQSGYEQGRREGFEAGHAEGLAAGRAQAQQERETLLTLVTRLTKPVAELDAQAETALVALALELARQVVLHDVQTQPEALLPMVRKALAAFPAQAGAPMLRLHPLDLEVLRKVAPEFEDEGVGLVGDDTLHRGDVIVASAAPGTTAMPDRRWRVRNRDAVSELDLRIEERWRQIMARLFEEGLQ